MKTPKIDVTPHGRRNSPWQGRDIEVAAPDKSTELVLYCGGGYRSALAADVLQDMGYTNVWSMAGGWKAWKESGAPVENS